jgi:hypothetical protein
VTCNGANTGVYLTTCTAIRDLVLCMLAYVSFYMREQPVVMLLRTPPGFTSHVLTFIAHFKRLCHAFYCRSSTTPYLLVDLALFSVPLSCTSSLSTRLLFIACLNDMASAIYLSDSAMRMDRDITTACTMHSEDPFSDDYALDEDAERGDYETSAIKEWQVWAGSQERTIAVPIIDLLPHLEAWSSAWSNTTPSTPSSPTQEALSAPLQWTDADLSM